MTDPTDSSDDPPAIGSREDQIAYGKILAESMKGIKVPTAQLMAVVEAGYLDDWIKLATVPREQKKTTSQKANLELCAIASVCLARNHPMPDVVRIRLAKALREIAEGNSADAALGVKRRAGVSEDPMDVVFREQVIAGFILRMTAYNGMTEAEAKNLACTEFAEAGESLDISTVEKIWRKLKPDPAAVTAEVAAYEWFCDRYLRNTAE